MKKSLISIFKKEFFEQPIWREELDKIEKCPQRQDSVTDQMIDLYSVAVKLGFYDAADYIKKVFVEDE